MSALSRSAVEANTPSKREFYIKRRIPEQGDGTLHSELLGTPLPDTPILWLVLLVSILTALGTLLAAVEKFLEMLKIGMTVLRRYGGLLLPVSWAVWCMLLLYWRFETPTVLVVLLGTLSITAIATTLYRRCRA